MWVFKHSTDNYPDELLPIEIDENFYVAIPTIDAMSQYDYPDSSFITEYDVINNSKKTIVIPWKNGHPWAGFLMMTDFQDIRIFFKKNIGKFPKLYLSNPEMFI